MMDYTSLIVAVLALLGTVLNYILNRRKQHAETNGIVASRSKTVAETADVLTDTAVDLARELGTRVSTLQGEIKDLQVRVTELERENAELSERYTELLKGTTRLVGQVCRLGEIPDYVPPGVVIPSQLAQKSPPSGK